MLTHPHEPLWTALTAPWPWAGVGVATFVLDEAMPRQGEHLQGFAQLLKRASRPEADLLHVAPAVMSDAYLEGGDGTAREAPGVVRSAEGVWSRLLAHCSLAASTHGLQRIYASTPEGCYEQTSLKQAGFCLYTRETIYRLATVPKAGPSGQEIRSYGIRSQHPAIAGRCSGCTAGARPGWCSRPRGRCRAARPAPTPGRPCSPGGSRTIGRGGCSSRPARCAARSRCTAGGPGIGCGCWARVNFPPGKFVCLSSRVCAAWISRRRSRTAGRAQST